MHEIVKKTKKKKISGWEDGTIFNTPAVPGSLTEVLYLALLTTCVAAPISFDCSM